MSFNDLHIKIATARPPLTDVKSKKGLTYRALIDTDEGLKRAYIKLLNVEDIAREVLCATLARKVSLPIRPCYYVAVDPSLAPHGRVGNPDSVAFGIEEDVYPVFRGNSQELDAEILKWDDALRCAVFDEWIFNRDRHAGNLVFVSNGVFWLIDHDEALPNYATPESSCGSHLLYRLAENKPEIDRYRIKQSAMQMVEQYQKIDWDEILQLVRPEVVSTSHIFYKKNIKFLQERVRFLPEIISESLGIKQRELELQTLPTKPKNLKEKD